MFDHAGECRDDLVSMLKAEIAEQAEQIRQKHERVRYFENRNTELATENINQAEQNDTLLLEVTGLNKQIEQQAEQIERMEKGLLMCRLQAKMFREPDLNEEIDVVKVCQNIIDFATEALAAQPQNKTLIKKGSET